MTVSTRSTEPSLLYILIQLRFMRCLTRRPGRRPGSLEKSSWSVTRSEVAVELAAEEGHHIARLEVERRVLEQTREELLEVCPSAEQDVGRVLRLRRHPIVAHRR